MLPFLDGSFVKSLPSLSSLDGSSMVSERRYADVIQYIVNPLVFDGSLMASEGRYADTIAWLPSAR